MKYFIVNYGTIYDSVYEVFLIATNCSKKEIESFLDDDVTEWAAPFVYSEEEEEEFWNGLEYTFTELSFGEFLEKKAEIGMRVINL